MNLNRKYTFLRSLLALMLVVITCLTVAMPAFAAPSKNGDDAWVDDGSEDGVKAGFTKELKMPEHTDTPDADFKFNVTKTKFNGSTTDLDDMPNVIDNATVNVITIPFKKVNDATPVNGVKTVAIESDELTEKFNFTVAGVYTYTITEDAAASTQPNPALNQTMDYSQASYEITFWVKERTKEGTSGVFVYAIGAVKITEDDGGDAGDVKVDPTPGTNNSVGNYSQMIFTNVYTRVRGGEEPKLSDNESLHISKTVEGSIIDSSRYFEFNIKVTKPAIFTEADITKYAVIEDGDGDGKDDDGIFEFAYKAYIISATNSIVTPVKDVSGNVGNTDGVVENDYIKVTTGTPVIIRLKHGERIVFNDTHVGALYEVTESAALNYTPSVIVHTNGAAAAGYNPLTGAISSSLEVSDQWIGEEDNSADFTNTFKEIPIMGVVTNSLPFVLIIALVVGGLVAFVVIKSRKGRRS